jgi:hypothetical protein
MFVCVCVCVFVFVCVFISLQVNLIKSRFIFSNIKLLEERSLHLDDRFSFRPLASARRDHVSSSAYCSRTLGSHSGRENRYFD